MLTVIFTQHGDIHNDFGRSMKKQCQAGVIAIALAGIGEWHAPILEAQVNQAAIAEQVIGEDIAKRNHALEIARAVGPRNLSPELRLALITALSHEGKILEDRYQSAQRGTTQEPLEDPEFIARLAEVVAELRDPEAIPALVDALGVGSTAIKALAAFGERAVPAVVAAVKAERRYDTVDGGLITLRFIVEGGSTRLSNESLNAIRLAAVERLSGEQHFTTLWRAIDLAVLLNDTDLRQRVEALSSDRNQIIAMAIRDPELIRRTRQRASDGLRGVPPLPRP
jgi:hypothetical protein